MALTVLMNAGPWLAVPPAGYGGIEAVVATLVGELRRRGHRVVLATVAESSLPCDGRVQAFEHGQFGQLQQPYNRVMGVAHAHMQAVVAELRRNRDIDLVHDHLEVVGPAVLAAMGRAGPPVLQTLHWSLGKHASFYGSFDAGGRVFFNALSPRQVELAPSRLRRLILDVVPLGIPVSDYPLVRHKDGYLLSLARITADKGQDVAARLCRERGLELRLAGPVAGASSPAELESSLADEASPLHDAPDVAFYLKRVRPLEDGVSVRWTGAVAGAEKIRLLSRARAAVFPVRWDEPGGTAVIEALACGTPVVAMRRGVMPELIDHGETGFLADTEPELASYLDRVGEIDPERCRRAAEERFSSEAMAARYVDLYAEVLERSDSRSSPRRPAESRYSGVTSNTA